MSGHGFNLPIDTFVSRAVEEEFFMSASFQGGSRDVLVENEENAGELVGIVEGEAGAWVYFELGTGLRLLGGNRLWGHFNLLSLLSKLRNVAR
jgi:hypothetical protein